MICASHKHSPRNIQNVPNEGIPQILSAIYINMYL